MKHTVRLTRFIRAECEVVVDVPDNITDEEIDQMQKGLGRLDLPWVNDPDWNKDEHDLFLNANDDDAVDVVLIRSDEGVEFMTPHIPAVPPKLLKPGDALK